jgi:hypothetical protein
MKTYRELRSMHGGREGEFNQYKRGPGDAKNENATRLRK